MKTILFSLDPDSIESAAKELRAYQKKVKGLGQTLVKRLTEDGVEQAKEIAEYMRVYDSGELVQGIVAEFRDEKGYIHSTAGHSAYCEFGTGLRGSQDPHPESAQFGWKYDVNEHGVKGWYYYGRDGKKHWTQGMPHRPFMYDTARILKESVEYVAKKEMEKE